MRTSQPTINETKSKSTSTKGEVSIHTSEDFKEINLAMQVIYSPRATDEDIHEANLTLKRFGFRWRKIKGEIRLVLN